MDTLHYLAYGSNLWPARLAAQPHGERGEFVLVLHARAAAVVAADALPAEALHVLDALLAELPLKQAAALEEMISLSTLADPTDGS